MKKIAYLSIIYGILTCIGLSCSNDSETEGITVDDLVGNWMFVSLQLNGKTTTDCDSALNVEYDLVTFSLKNVNTTTMTLYTTCTDNGLLWEQSSGYSLSGNTIILPNNFTFDIENTSTKTTLILKLTSAVLHPEYPIGGIYTLNKVE
jgi:hypothetical protein